MFGKDSKPFVFKVGTRSVDGFPFSSFSPSTSHLNSTFSGRKEMSKLSFSVLFNGSVRSCSSSILSLEYFFPGVETLSAVRRENCLKPKVFLKMLTYFVPLVPLSILEKSYSLYTTELEIDEGEARGRSSSNSPY